MVEQRHILNKTTPEEPLFESTEPDTKKYLYRNNTPKKTMHLSLDCLQTCLSFTDRYIDHPVLRLVATSWNKVCLSTAGATTVLCEHCRENSTPAEKLAVFFVNTLHLSSSAVRTVARWMAVNVHSASVLQKMAKTSVRIDGCPLCEWDDTTIARRTITDVACLHHQVQTIGHVRTLLHAPVEMETVVRMCRMNIHHMRAAICNNLITWEQLLRACCIADSYHMLKWTIVRFPETEAAFHRIIQADSHSVARLCILHKAVRVFRFVCNHLRAAELQVPDLIGVALGSRCVTLMELLWRHTHKQIFVAAWQSNGTLLQLVSNATDCIINWMRRKKMPPLDLRRMYITSCFVNEDRLLRAHESVLTSVHVNMSSAVFMNADKVVQWLAHSPLGLHDPARLTTDIVVGRLTEDHNRVGGGGFPLQFWVSTLQTWRQLHPMADRDVHLWDLLPAGAKHRLHDLYRLTN